MADIKKINLNGTEYAVKDGSALADAPADGKTYGRNNGAWSAVSSFTDEYKQKVDDLWADYRAALGVI